MDRARRRPRYRVLAVALATLLIPLVVGSAAAAASQLSSALPLPHPQVSDYVQVSSSETPPTQAQCNSVGRRCFTPQADPRRVQPQPALRRRPSTAAASTIAIVDSYGSDTMAHDLHVSTRSSACRRCAARRA